MAMSPATSDLFRACGQAGTQLLFGMEITLWLSVLSFSTFPQLGLLPTLRNFHGERRVGIGRYSLLLITVIFLLAGVDYVASTIPDIELLAGKPPSPNPEKLQPLRGIILLVLTLFSAVHITHRLYVIWCREMTLARLLFVPTSLMVAGVGCGIPVFDRLAGPVREQTVREKRLTIAFFSLFGIHRVWCATAIALRLLRDHQRLVRALVAKWKAMKARHAVSVTERTTWTPASSSIKGSTEREIEREFLFLARTFMLSSGGYSSALLLFIVLHSVKSPATDFAWHLLPQITALASTLSLLQTSMSVIYNGIKQVERSVRSSVHFVKGKGKGKEPQRDKSPSPPPPPIVKRQWAPELSALDTSDEDEDGLFEPVNSVTSQATTGQDSVASTSRQPQWKP
ncbi:hypothetical protein SISNIDRAFT_463995 [Sistotremastrum niveocremeum HHB9708]|uniref:Uncharacterized protein n=1 Tax=Sistotremastrum niveocremeum HHB9708 TaxID=1314777 RepID=A0A164Y2S2_9AGAM|nr:hypothetical protein SISNIDRAFT_463995 [Sistotremastrum niveocremeum HHB9708]